MDFDGALRHRASTGAVLDFAWDAGAFRADHVISACGLTRSTTLAALDTLIDIRLIRELESSAATGNRLGRPARRFELRGEAGLVVGIDAGNQHFTAVVADLSGSIVAQRQLDTGPIRWVDQIPRQDAGPRRLAVFQVIDEALAEAGRAREDVVAVGLGVPAPVDGKAGSPAHPSGFWQYMNADLHAALSASFPAVRMENDAALAAVAEGDVGEARGCDHFVAMLAGARLGSGVVLEGRLVRGAHGGVGEMEALSYMSDIGGAWGIGDLAEKWVRSALEKGTVPAGHPWAGLTAETVTAEAVLAQADPSDPVCSPMLDELGAKLGRICTVLSRFYDPELIVVCGAMAGALGEVLEIARRKVAAESELPPPAIVASALGGDVVARGAVCAAREVARDIVLPLLAAR